jgi:hypothetical protein
MTRRDARLTCAACGWPLASFCPRCRGQAGGRVGGLATSPEKTAAAREAVRTRWSRRDAARKAAQARWSRRRKP